jgi:cytosine/adenosine deaminase-related metal-dependent hydrolase
MRKISADLVFPVSSPAIENGVVIIDDAGKILAVERREQHDPASLDIRRGALAPGFVNTHCHLELSHMKGKVDTGTGLIPFITSVVTQRNAAPEAIAEAIGQAEAEMLAGGIVALGDISNTPDTFAVKARGRMRYYTFIELFDFLQEPGADKAFADWSAVYGQLKPAPGSARSLAPHAPYSVSKNLFRKINEFNAPSDLTVSIHNQETPPENELFERGSGAFYEFYGKFGISLEQFRPTGKSSIFYALENLNPAQRTLFVHNTLTTRLDIEAAHAWSPHVYWATCPNANLYIENRLPNYRVFLDTEARVTIGTDSLTSNWQLSVWEEIKTIARYQSYVPFDAMLRWATLNGASALGFDDTLGSLELGKTPGLVWIQGLAPGGRMTMEATAQRLA